ncbi:MAG: PAS domain S-box protein [Candidatus Omnitrophica bacterium]|nr:PAS domain S-box protein [Candidatus Omnitrophota bacterium]
MGIKINKNEIKETFLFLNKVLDFVPEATFAIDQKGVLIAWNKAIENLTGVTAKEMLGKGNYEYAIPFYGRRKPVLIDFIFKKSRPLKGKYINIRAEKDILIAETEQAMIKGKNSYLWAKAGAIREPSGKIIGAIETIRDITKLKSYEKDLQESKSCLNEQKIALEQKNIDLQDILRQVESEKKRIKHDVINNVQGLVLPLIKKLQLKGESRKLVHLLHKSIEELASSFGTYVFERRLSPREIEVGNMIKNGLTGKEISRLLNISFETVEMHRKNIRKKLGLVNKKVNLASYLLNI